MGNLSTLGSRNSARSGRVRHVTVSPDQAGQRLDNFLLRELKGLPKSRVYRLVRKGEVRVNLGRVDAGYRLQSGDDVRIPPVRLGTASDIRPPANLETGEILFEDAHMLVLDKPAGISVHKGTGIHAGLIEALRARRPELPYLELVHRLDRDTSGCLMLAKSRAALTTLHASLRRESNDPVTKRYAALIKGAFDSDPVTVHTQLRKNSIRGGERMVVVVEEEGDPAESIFRLTRTGEFCSRVEIELVTGRTHQARVHAAHIGHPIAGDRKYGEREFNRRMRRAGVGRLALHARQLAFAHPISGEQCLVEAPLPALFEAVCDGST